MILKSVSQITTPIWSAPVFAEPQSAKRTAYYLFLLIFDPKIHWDQKMIRQLHILKNQLENLHYAIKMRDKALINIYYDKVTAAFDALRNDSRCVSVEL
jgi:hypothetical protein